VSRPAAHIEALTGIRGVASFWVLLHHAPNLYPLGAHPLPAPLQRILDKGWLGVDLFFVLSGFVISYVYATSMARFDAREAIRFLKLRLVRIYPAHFVATLAFAPVYIGAHFLFGYTSPNDAFSLEKLAFALTLTNGWGFDVAGWNVPSWSVSSEWFAYLCFPLLAPLLVRLRGAAANLTAIAAVFGVMIALAFAINDGAQFILPPHLTLTRIGSEFVVGCLLWNLYRDWQGRGARGFDVAAGFACVGTVAISASGAPALLDAALVGLFALLVLALALAQGPVSGLFRGRAMVYLGEVSYSIYLIHTVLLLVMGQALQRVVPDAGSASPVLVASVYAAFVAASLFAGHLLYRFVEEPARSYLRRVWVR